MKPKKTTIAFFISVAALAAVLSLAGGVIHAQGPDTSGSPVAAKLDRVLANQKSIIEDLAAIKEELRIIKIRVTQSQ